MRPVPSVAQAMAPGVGRMEGDAAEGSPRVVVLGKRLASAPLNPNVARGVSQWGHHGERGLWRLELMGSHPWL